MSNTTKPEVKELLSKLSTIRKEVSSLRSKLNDMNTVKESLFEEKDVISKKIVAAITQIKQFKRERDEYTKKVKKLKGDRKVFNDQIKVRSSSLKGLLDKKDAFKKTNQIKGNPTKIQKKIEELEF